jgi:hypothetical protein
VRDLISLIQRAEADNAVRVLVFKSADPAGDCDKCKRSTPTVTSRIGCAVV